jgi:hypothetical protein
MHIPRRILKGRMPMDSHRTPHHIRSLLVLLALLVAAQPAGAQGPAKPPDRARVDVPTVAPRPEDVSSVDGIVRAFYDVISGPAGQARQWARDRTLYVPGARLVALSVRGGKPHAEVRDHQSFVDASNDSLVRGGFFEREIHRVTRSFGNLTHVFSTYEWSTSPGGPVGGRGVNSIEFYNDGTRWWIVAAVWDEERPDNPIPKELLPPGSTPK